MQLGNSDGAFEIQRTTAGSRNMIETIGDGGDDGARAMSTRN